MQWLLDLVTGGLTSLIANWGGQILAGLGALGMTIVAYFSGKKAERQKGQIHTQKEIIDAYETRNTVEDVVRSGGTTERDRMRQRYTRDE